MNNIIIYQKDLDVAEIEMNFYKTGNSGNFTTTLIDAIHRADNTNFYKLAQGFPEYCYLVAKAMNPHLVKIFKVIE